MENAPRFGGRNRPEVRFHGGVTSLSCDFGEAEEEGGLIALVRDS